MILCNPPIVLDLAVTGKYFIIVIYRYRLMNMMPGPTRCYTTYRTLLYFVLTSPASKSAFDSDPSAANAAMQSNAEIEILPLAALGGNKGACPTNFL
jgi:hypothetical protein